MKKLLYLILLSGIVASCGGNKDESYETMVARRDSLKEAKSKIAEELSLLEEELRKSDTTATKNTVMVETATTAIGTFEHFFQVQGNVEVEKNSLIYPEMMGEIKEIRAKEGERVSKGDVLMVLNADVLQRSYDEAQTRHDLAKTVFERQGKLWEQKIGSEIQYLEAKANYESAKKSLETIKTQIANATIRAPYSGIIDEVMPKLGEMAAPQAPVMRLINLDQIYIKSDISESYLSKIKKGDEVIVDFPSLEYSTNAKIHYLGNFINPNNRTFKIQLFIDNKEGILKPNLLAYLRIRDFSADSAIAIPSDVVQQDANGESFVFVVEEKDGEAIAYKREVEIGKAYKGFTHIVSGLKPNETYITKGGRSVKDGEVVKTAATQVAQN